jgi:hypothetical protein
MEAASGGISRLVSRVDRNSLGVNVMIKSFGDLTNFRQKMAILTNFRQKII